MFRVRAAVCLASMLAFACGGSSGGGHVSKRTIVERTPNGTRTITVTTRTVEAPPPPPRPADPMPNDALVRYNVERLNHYRARAGVGPLLYDAKISSFAHAGSRQLSDDHHPHAHFAAHAEGAPGFGSHSAENQGDPNGVPPFEGDHVASGKKQIDIMLKLMMDEGPGGGHHDNMLNPKYRRIGIGLYYVGGTLYLTNDFSD
jgi:hypothetical protein